MVGFGWRLLLREVAGHRRVHRDTGAGGGRDGAALDEILRAKPSSSKGRYLKKVVVSTTTGPGIPVDPSVTRNFTEEPAS